MLYLSRHNIKFVVVASLQVEVQCREVTEMFFFSQRGGGFGLTSHRYTLGDFARELCKSTYKLAKSICKLRKSTLDLYYCDCHLASLQFAAFFCNP